jgi:MFS family permease
MAVTPDSPTLSGAEAGTTKVSRSAMIISSVFLFWLVGLIDKFAFGTILTDRGFLTDLGLTGHAAILGALASLAVLTQALGYGVFGWAVDRFGPRPCAIVGVSGWVVSGVLVLVVGLVPGAPYLVLIAAIVTIIYGVTLLIVQGFQDITTEVHRVGTENGLMNALSNLLAGAVPFGMGWLIDIGGGGYGYAFGFLFLLLAISGVAAVGMHRLGY